jgi:gliding motility-associated-like protein
LKSLTSLTCLIAILCSSLTSFCQYANLEFIENKGQWDSRIKFRGLMNNGAFYLQEKGFRVTQSNNDDLDKLAEFFHGSDKTDKTTVKIITKKSKVENNSTSPETSTDKVVVRSHAYDVQFVNAGTPTILPDKPLDSHTNYFIGNDPKQWASDCKTFQAVTYHNLYNGIDVRYYTNEGKLKYDVIVNPSANLSQVAMKYDGVEDLLVRDEQLVIKTSVGETKELAPYAYQIINGVKKEVGCRFKVSGKLVQFVVANYNKDALLVIDPALVFSTFTGSSADNWGYTATYGPDQSFYAGGIVFSSGFPTNPGAYQTTYAGGANDVEGIGGYDIGIMKFSPDGANRVYATYIGGSGNESPHSLVVDQQGNLVISGKTNSPNYPTIGTNFGTGGDFDIIITKLNATGSALLGSKKIGGTGRDGVNINPKYASPRGPQSIRRNYGDDSRSEVILDAAGNIWVASCTQSSDFPTINAFQSTFAGSQDGVLIKASPDLSTILSCSFLGGPGDDAAFVLALNPSNNNIYVGGNTTSTTNFPGDKTGVLNPTFKGGVCDGFVAIVSNDGKSLIKSSYFGTDGNDMLYGIQFDKFSFPYIMGTTTGDWTVVNAQFSQPGAKQFISKLKPDLSGYEYSTIFGTNSLVPNISPVAFLVDRCENVYVSGWGGEINIGQQYPNAGTTGLSVTSDAIQRNTDGSDFYFFVLEKNATKQLYGSFYGQSSTNGGGEHVDGGTSRFDRQGVIYQAMCANCGRTAPFPTTPGVWSPTNGSRNCNLAAVKIAFNLAGITSSIRSTINGVPRDTSGCVPLTVDFTDTVGAGKSYVWNFGDGSKDTTTTGPTAKHTFQTIGSFRVRLVSIDSATCNIADTAYTTIRVRNDEAIASFTQAKLPPCQSTAYRFVNTSIPALNKPFKANSFTWYFGDNSAPVVAGADTIIHTFPGIGTYKVRLILTDTNYCNAPDSMVANIRISPNVKAQFETPRSGCAPYTAIINNTSAGGQQFFWDFGDGTTSTAANPTHSYPTPGSYTIRLKAVDSATCNIVDSTSLTIVVSSKPTSSFTYSPNPPLENTAVQFFNTATGATNYLWNFGDGDTLKTVSTNVVSHIFNETRKYTTCLVAINDFGCMDTSCQDVQAKVIPVLDVPNAFTPNGDGVNDYVFVRGFGITKMMWRIYNRWGTVVFETSDRKQGWNGMYKGKLQPKEVYTYVLDVEFSDGTKYQKKGDITLL